MNDATNKMEELSDKWMKIDARNECESLFDKSDKSLNKLKIQERTQDRSNL